MHACGHDNHVAILMGVAEVLAGMRDELPGTVLFVFQPAEERVAFRGDERRLAGTPGPRITSGTRISPS